MGSDIADGDSREPRELTLITYHPNYGIACLKPVFGKGLRIQRNYVLEWRDFSARVFFLVTVNRYDVTTLLVHL